jgi:hypothetical protein
VSPALPRGNCPVCGEDVALRNGALVREHRTAVAAWGDAHRSRDRSSKPFVCLGSGQKAAGR